MRFRRQLSGLVVLVIALACVGLVAPGAGAGDIPEEDEGPPPYLLNDSPMYTFEGGVPTRNAPVAVASVLAFGHSDGIELDLRQVAFFAPTDVPVTARVAFYGRRPKLAGGIEFRWGTGSGEVDATLVERAEEGTGTSPEVWEEADEDFATVTGTYDEDGAVLVISAKGSYRKLVRDPRSAFGIDLLLGEPGSSVQPSARVSIGALTGTRPGLLAFQGTGVGEDGTPEPWTTIKYAGEFAGFRIAAAVEPPTTVTVDLGKQAASAVQVRVFVANVFASGAPGEPFPGYQLVLFTPTDTTVPVRIGDAFASVEGGPVTITPGDAGRFGLGFSEPLRGSYAAVQTVLPGDGADVLLATPFRLKF